MICSFNNVIRDILNNARLKLYVEIPSFFTVLFVTFPHKKSALRIQHQCICEAYQKKGLILSLIRKIARTEIDEIFWVKKDKMYSVFR